MNRWITDRAPTHDDIDDRQTCWVIIEGKVQQATGWWLKTNWGQRPELTAWEPKPTSEVKNE
jgi:hypothetical protein